MAADIFEAFEDPAATVDDLLSMAPSAVPLPEPKHLPTIPGRTSPAPFSLQQLAKEYTADALHTIIAIMTNEENEPSTRLEAAKHLLDRGWGKSTIKAEIKSQHTDVHKVLEALASQVKDPPRLGQMQEDNGAIIDVAIEEVVNAPVSN